MSDTVESNPKATPSYRLALGVAIALGVLIVIAIGVLIIGFAMGWNKPHTPSAAAPAPKNPVHMTLAQGYTILSADTQPGRLVLHLRSTAKDEIDIIDLGDGHIISVISAQSPK